MSSVRLLGALPLHVEPVHREALQLALIDLIVWGMHHSMLRDNFGPFNRSQEFRTYAIVLDDQLDGWLSKSARPER